MPVWCARSCAPTLLSYLLFCRFWRMERALADRQGGTDGQVERREQPAAWHVGKKAFTQADMVQRHYSAYYICMMDRTHVLARMPSAAKQCITDDGATKQRITGEQTK